MLRRSPLSLGLGLCVVLVAPAARATENFPGVIATKLGVSAPACTICHTSNAGGRGTVTTPFGVSLRSRGAVAYDEAALATALDALAGENKDSDGDGTGDIAELRAGGDPNVGAGGGDTIVPEYGCSASPSRAADPFAFVAAAAVASVLLGRRRRRG